MDGIVVGAGHIGAYVCVVMSAFVGYMVVSRYGFNSGILGGDVVAGGLAIWMALLVAAWVLREDRHTRVDFILRMLKPRARVVLNCMTSFLCMLASLLFCWESSKAVWGDYTQRVVVVVGWPVDPPRWIFFAPLAIGSFLLAWQFLRNLQGYFREFGSLKK